MKIRKFNEAYEPLDIEYIKQCFIDFIDSGAGTKIDGNFIEISIELPMKFALAMGSKYEYISDENNKLEKFIDGHEKNNEFFKEIRNCMAKLVDEYPDYRVSAQIGSADSWSNYIHIMILLDNKYFK
jgi:hypothetical protein